MSPQYRSRPLLSVAVAATVAALALVACGSFFFDGQGYASETVVAADYGVTAPEAALTDASERTLAAYHGTVGTFLVDGATRPLYLFEKDAEGWSACSRTCAAAWPPVPASQESEVGAGVKADLLGRTDRADGTAQLTYAGHPLCRFVEDTKPGQPTGDGARRFGAVWHVEQPSGGALEGTVQP